MKMSLLDIPRDRLADLCRKWGITELSLFGSALRDDFGPDSDVDFLVTLDPAARTTLLDLERIRAELQSLLRRPVDLVERPALERHHNPWLKHAILTAATPLYRAA